MNSEMKPLVEVVKLLCMQSFVQVRLDRFVSWRACCREKHAKFVVDKRDHKRFVANALFKNIIKEFETLAELKKKNAIKMHTQAHKNAHSHRTFTYTHTHTHTHTPKQTHIHTTHIHTLTLSIKTYMLRSVDLFKDGFCKIVFAQVKANVSENQRDNGLAIRIDFCCGKPRLEGSLRGGEEEGK